MKVLEKVLVLTNTDQGLVSENTCKLTRKDRNLHGKTSQVVSGREANRLMGRHSDAQ